jgi:Flp pilus assembly protein TadG
MRHAARRLSTNSKRRGAVAVECAIVAPIMVAIVLGMIELGRALEMQNVLEVAAREGARFASMEKDGLVDPGQSANDKLIEDVKNFLASNGISKEGITVEIKDHENPSNDFDLDDPDNDLRLFEVRVSVDWSDMSLTPVATSDDHALVAVVVFRNGRATISD